MLPGKCNLAFSTHLYREIMKVIPYGELLIKTFTIVWGKTKHPSYKTPVVTHSADEFSKMRK
jgi:hypothetical protein